MSAPFGADLLYSISKLVREDGILTEEFIERVLVSDIINEGMEIENLSEDVIDAWFTCASNYL